MSFSGDVKKELVSVIPKAQHCRVAEIASFFEISGKIEREEDGKYLLYIHAEHPDTTRKVFTLITKAFNIGVDILSDQGRGRNPNRKGVCVHDQKGIERIKRAVSHQMLLSMDCCRRAYLRGAFLSGGSISAPEKYYHLEIVCPDQKSAERVQSVMKNFDLDAKIVTRKKSYVVYLKEGAQIVEVLGLMGADISLLNLENIRVMKEVRGEVNRKVNCETANLDKTVVASLRQLTDIEYIQSHGGLDQLTPAIRQIAEARLAFPDGSLTELGRNIRPAVGKSGVNHRLRKLEEFAALLRESKDEGYKEE